MRRRLLFNGYYPEAKRFIDVAGITNDTQKHAINYLVGAMKAANLWTKCYAVYPIVGGTSTTHSYNLINPSQYQLTYTGTVSHGSTGMQGNGTTGYANTGFNPTTAGVGLNDFGFGMCSATNQARTEVDMGARNAAATAVCMILARDAANVSQHQVNNNNVGTLTQAGILTSLGHFANNRLNNTQIRVARNGAITVFAQASGTLTNRDIHLMALLTNATVSLFSSKLYTFFRIHLGLSDADEAAFETIISNYNTILGR